MRTVAGRRDPGDLTSLPPCPDRKNAFSFCTDRTPGGVRHDLCPGQTHTNPGKKDDKVNYCACCLSEHGRAR